MQDVWGASNWLIFFRGAGQPPTSDDTAGIYWIWPNLGTLEAKPSVARGSDGRALRAKGRREHEQVEHVWVTGGPGLEWFLPSKYIQIYQFISTHIEFSYRSLGFPVNELLPFKGGIPRIPWTFLGQRTWKHAFRTKRSLSLGSRPLGCPNMEEMRRLEMHVSLIAYFSMTSISTRIILVDDRELLSALEVTTHINHLVGGLEHVLFFHNIWE